MSSSVFDFFKKHWFLVGLVSLVGGGLSLGMTFSDATLKGWEDGQGFGALAYRAPRLITQVVLFLMAFSLDSGKLRESLRAPLPVLWAF